MFRSLLAASAIVAAILAPGAASASSSDSDYRGRNVVTDTIRVDDLDLATEWGMDRLIKRLRGRIDDMCGWEENCRDEAWLSADWQVARELDHAQWRRRIAYERGYDQRYNRMRRAGPLPQVTYEPASTVPESAPRIAYAPPPGKPVARTVTTTDQTFTVRTTTVTLTYRVPPPDYRATWTPRCACEQ